jgi:hypothetical protein
MQDVLGRRAWIELLLNSWSRQGAEPTATIGQREPADLRVRVRNHRDLVTSLNLSVTATNDSAVQSPVLLRIFHLDADRLAARRPDAASVEIANVAILAPAVASDVFSPAVTSVPSTTLYPPAVTKTL